MPKRGQKYSIKKLWDTALEKKWPLVVGILVVAILFYFLGIPLLILSVIEITIAEKHTYSHLTTKKIIRHEKLKKELIDVAQSQHVKNPKILSLIWPNFSYVCRRC